METKIRMRIYERFAAACAALCAAILLALPIGAAAQEVSAEEAAKMLEAAPAKPRVQPVKPRKLLVFNLCRGFKHSSIPYAAKAVEIMGRKSGAFEAVLTEDEEMFAPERLSEFDAVLLNNNTGGGYFKDKRLQESFESFISGGKGLVGIHGATDGWFGGIFGGYFACHPWNEEVWVKLDDPFHALNAVFGGDTFKIADEIYVFREDESHSRSRLRILNSLDLTRTKDKGPRKDKDYAVSWVAKRGEGRIFYCSLGHRHELFWNPTVLQFYLDGIQFALGDLPADTEPSAAYEARMSELAKPLNELASKTDSASFDDLARAAADDSDVIMRALALQALARRGDKAAAPAISKAMKEENARVRGAAVNAWIALACALGEKGDRAEAVKMLEEAAGFGAGARRAAMVGMGKFGSEDRLPFILDSMAEDDDEIRGAALAALSAMLPADKAAAAAAGAMKSEPPAKRASALRALSRYGDARAAPVLIAFMEDSDESARIAAIETLGAVGDASAAPVLAQAAASVAQKQKDAARSALAKLPGAGDALEQGAADTDEEPEIRAEFVRALAARGMNSSTPAILKAYEADDERLKLACLEAMVELADPGDDATRSFWEQAMDAAEDLEEKKIVIKGIGRLGNVWALEYLSPYLDESWIEDAALRPAAALACVEAAEKAKKEHPQQAKAALELVLQTADDEALVKRAAAILEAIK